MSVDPATQAILDLPVTRAHREAVRAHEALMRYGQHDDDCSHDDGFCDCGLDAACYSPFVEEPALMKLLCALLGHREGGPVYHGFVLCPRCWKPVEHVNRRGWL